uniref:Xylulose kinase-1 n=1 Tax=Tanacetum cinerariifolium TaxID=118510 RepID=A0A699H1F0_TANCI|nr:xylulose kinase-1 [Tanacetum cinerariifolium]
MTAPVISISSDVLVKSVGSSFSRVILISSISVEVSVAPEVGAAVVASPTRVLELDTHSSSKADPLESSLPPVSVAPMVSLLLCLADSKSDTEIPERHVSPTPHDAMLTRWRSRFLPSRVIVPTGRYVVPTGRVIIPTGRYVVPTGRLIVATGRYVVPAGSDDDSDDASIHNEATNTQQLPNIQPQIITTVSNNNAKFPYLKKDETGRDHDGRVIILHPTTTEEHIAVQGESKARTTLLQSVPDDHVADFHYMDDARDIWNAVKARFGGNDESKKMRKSMLKQEFLEFRIDETEGLHKGYDRMQKILSQLN